jgi:3-hydroxyisobutyrate dehydrogenase
VETVGLVGLGQLGSAIASRLLKGGFEVVGYDLDHQRREWLEKMGGSSATVYEIALSSRRIVVCVRAHETVVELVPVLLPGTIVIDTTSAEPKQSEAAAKLFRKRGIAYLDAPCCDWHTTVSVSGGKVVCGGDANALSACRNILDAFANPLIYAGPPGSGMRMKRELEQQST